MSTIPPKAEVKLGVAIGNLNSVANDHPRSAVWLLASAGRLQIQTETLPDLTFA
jgi:hypothetical protein